MPQLVLIRGLPGSGKSTLARAFVGAGYKHREADTYHIDPATGIYKFESDNVKPSHAWCRMATKYLLECEQDVVVSNTFTMQWELDEYLNLGFPTSIVIAKGGYQNIHNVPEEVLVRMAERWED